MRSLLRKLFRFLVKLGLVLALVAAVGGYFAWRHFEAFADAPAGAPEDATLVVARGDSFVQVLRKLRTAGVEAGHDLEWKVLATRMQALPRIQVGEYALDPALTPRQLIEKLVRGDVIRYRFTIVEGWSMRDLRAALARDAVLEDDIASLDDVEVAEAIGDVVEALLRDTDLPDPWNRIASATAEPLGALAAAVIMRHLNADRRAERRSRWTTRHL
jgi:UPF0755 protein